MSRARFIVMQLNFPAASVKANPIPGPHGISMRTCDGTALIRQSSSAGTTSIRGCGPEMGTSGEYD